MLLDRTHREFFWLLVRRDLKVRYAGSTLGGAWNVIHPIVMIAIYMTIFSTIMSDIRPAGPSIRDYGGLSYGVHLIAGLLPWLLFSDVLIRSTGILIENGNLLQKVSFPPIVLFASALFNALLVYGGAFLLFFALLALLGHPVPWIAAPAGLALMALLACSATGLGLILAGLNVFFRDVGQLLQVVMQILFWFNPIVYYRSLIFDSQPATATEQTLVGIGRTLILANPIERFITAIQSLFGVTSHLPAAADWIVIGLFPILAIALGITAFRRMLPDVRDCL